MKYFQLLLLLLLLFLQSSCEKILFSDTGKLSSATYQYDEFTRISVYDIFDIEIDNDSVFSVKLTTPENLLPNISFNLDSTGNLSIYDNNQHKWLPEYPRPKLKIVFPSLDDYMLIKAPVKITSTDTIRLNKLRFVFLGKTGEFNIKMNTPYFQMETGSDNFAKYVFGGVAHYANIWARGSSIVDASHLQSDSCYVYNNSIGDCRVTASKKLTVRLNTLGNIYYTGNPDEIVIQEERGEGRLIKE
jgi:Putative auto-transporter adhesin, head GIN domain